MKKASKGIPAAGKAAKASREDLRQASDDFLRDEKIKKIKGIKENRNPYVIETESDVRRLGYRNRKEKTPTEVRDENYFESKEARICRSMRWKNEIKKIQSEKVL